VTRPAGPAISVGQTLAWRLDRHHLFSGAPSVPEVVHRLIAVPAWSGDADLAIRRRLTNAGPGAVRRALADGDLIRTYAFHGATHLMTAQDAGTHLTVRGANRQWERASWQAHYGLQPADWPDLRDTVREAVATGPVSQSELADAVTVHSRFRHLQPGLADPGQTLLKAFAWQGDICFGPTRDGQTTFQSPMASPRWTGLVPLEDAGPRAVLAYLAGYGPATLGHLHHWLVAGLSAGRRRLESWVADLTGDRVAELLVDGEPMLALREHLDGLAAQEPSTDVTLLPGHDQWVLGPGTADERIVPPARRAPVTRGAALVLNAGVVAGTWRVAGTQLAVSWFREAGSPPRPRIETEAARLGRLLDTDLALTVTID